MAPVRGVRSNLAGRETGRRRRAPKEGLDPVKDFDEPVRKEPEQISNEQLAADNPTAELPAMVRDGLMAVKFVKPHPEIDKDENRTAAMEFSLTLGQDHRELLPRRIREDWEYLSQSGNKSMNLIVPGPFYVELKLTPDGDDHGELELKAAMIEKVQLAAIEEKGSGEARDVVRLSFRVIADLEDRDVRNFACLQFGKTIWLRMAPVQGALL